MAVVERDGEQVPLWADMRTASREHMEVAFQQRRRGIIGDCKQLKNDVDSFNQNFNSAEAIQIIFDFTDDRGCAHKLPSLMSALLWNLHGQSRLPGKLDCT